MSAAVAPDQGLLSGVIGENAFDKRVSAAFYLKSNEFLVENEGKMDEQVAVLDAELEKIPSDKKAALMQAQEKNMITEADKICFLRAEEFDAALAAERLRQNWETRLELFGPELAFEPLTLEGALRNDAKALETGFAQVTTAKDDAERGILFLSPSRYVKKEHDIDSMVRMIWYMVYSLLENENVQKHGMILMVNPRDVGFGNINRALQRKAAFSVSKCLPMRIGAFHVCQPSWVFRLSIPFLRFFIGPKLRQVFHVSAGSSNHIMEQLQKYGIQATQVPSNIDGGKLELDHKKWLEEQKAK